MIEVAKRLENPGNIIYSLIDGVHVPCREASFNIIISIYVLQYIITQEELIRKILAEMYRTLKPNGQFALIEQASNIEKTSGTVKHFASQGIYTARLKEFFTVAKCIPVRLGAKSLCPGKMDLICRYLPDSVLGWFTAQTVRSSKKMSIQELDSVPYYDCLFLCRKG